MHTQRRDNIYYKQQAGAACADTVVILITHLFVFIGCVGDALAESSHARLLPSSQLLPITTRRHVGRRHWMPRIHLGEFLPAIHMGEFCLGFAWGNFCRPIRLGEFLPRIRFGEFLFPIRFG